MTALALFEARKIARNPLLWVGAALLFAFGWINSKDYLPVVPGDVEFNYEGVVVLAAFAVFVGGWVGLRDRTSGAEALLASTPLKQRGLLVPARMTALAVVGFLALATVVLATTASSLFRGGRGWPDPFLLLDAGLYVAMAACAGFAIGHLTGSRIASLLSAPLLPGFVYYMQGRLSGRVYEPLWLLPNPETPGRFGPLGYLPDVLPIHSAYLGGALLALVGMVWYVRGKQDRATSIRWALAASLTGAAVFVVAGGWLSVQPTRVYVFGDDPSQVVAIGSDDDYRKLKRESRKAGPFADSDYATECAESRGFVACVFPENGPELAQLLAEDIAVLAPFTSLDGIPRRVRMIPTSEDSGVEPCATEGEVLVGSNRWSKDFWQWDSVGRSAFSCALFGRRQISNRTTEAVSGWFDVRVRQGLTGRRYDEALRQGWGAQVGRAVRSAGSLPIEEVVERLEPLWQELRARELTLAELERALRT